MALKRCVVPRLFAIEMGATHVVNATFSLNTSWQRGRITVQNGMIHPQHVWPESAGGLVRGTLGTALAPIQPQVQLYSFPTLVLSHRLTYYPSPRPLVQDDCERIQTLPTSTATRSPLLSPTFFPLFDLRTTTIGTSRNCAAPVSLTSPPPSPIHSAQR